ncbi:4a-hydroxytetrahydrobiopterin dehydratase [uncultured Rhodospira sp.]|uniref:4a-hydroxytetrahydrobiopterin dehydratase n=1 Tax=uncultured Rhodospira sp. TaxID=1936189 RepID=UPI00260FBBA7|nr:4a-hydroxytetrahydrobiopterin dehydratase [uncultured Rhodospira sp.]
MTDTTDTPPGWGEQRRPPGLFRRFDFDAYGQTRAFLDRAAALSESAGLHPDLSFGRTYVNVTVRPRQDGTAVCAAERDLAAQLSGLAAEQRDQDTAS